MGIFGKQSPTRLEDGRAIKLSGLCPACRHHHPVSTSRQEPTVAVIWSEGLRIYTRSLGEKDNCFQSEQCIEQHLGDIYNRHYNMQDTLLLLKHIFQEYTVIDRSSKTQWTTSISKYFIKVQSMAFTCPCHLENGCAFGLQMAFAGCYPFGYRSSYLKEENNLWRKTALSKNKYFNCFYLKSEDWEKW